MVSEGFINELTRKLEQTVLPKQPSCRVFFYKDGFTADGNREDIELIRSTNIRYHQVESDVLMGNYVMIKRKDTRDMTSLCRYDADDLFAVYIHKGWDEVLNIIKGHLEECDRLDNAGVLTQLENYEAVREHLIIRPINFTANQYDLKNCVFELMGDIALVLYLVISEDESYGLGTAKVPGVIFEKWERSLEDVWNAALFNTYVLAPPRMYEMPWECYKPPYTKGAFMALGSDMDIIEFHMSPTVTTTKQVNGAIAMFYPGVMERIAEMAGGSYYVVFTSIHEAKIHCAGSVDPGMILNTLLEVNQMFDKEETLSEKIYFYDADKKSIGAYEF